MKFTQTQNRALKTALGTVLAAGVIYTAFFANAGITSTDPLDRMIELILTVFFGGILGVANYVLWRVIGTDVIDRFTDDPSLTTDLTNFLHGVVTRSCATAGSADASKLASYVGAEHRKLEKRLGDRDLADDLAGITYKIQAFFEIVDHGDSNTKADLNDLADALCLCIGFFNAAEAAKDDFPNSECRARSYVYGIDGDLDKAWRDFERRNRIY